MAKNQHTNYDKRDANALLRSSILDAIMAAPGTRFDSAEDVSGFFARELDHVSPTMSSTPSSPLSPCSPFPARLTPALRPSPTTLTTSAVWQRSSATTPPTCPALT